MSDENLGIGDPLSLTDEERAALARQDADKSNDPLSHGPEDRKLAEIPTGWADLHWKQVVALARQIDPSQSDIGLDDARRIITDELALRDVPKGNDGLIEVMKGAETLRINPSTIEAHKKVGWKLA